MHPGDQVEGTANERSRSVSCKILSLCAFAAFHSGSAAGVMASMSGLRMISSCSSPCITILILTWSWHCMLLLCAARQQR